MGRVVLTLAAVMLSSTSLFADGLGENAVPAEVPPASFEGRQYVDSRGCVYVRAGFGGSTQWVPRVQRDRSVICGMRPTPVEGATSVAAARGPVIQPPSQSTPAPVIQPPRQAAASAPAPAPRVLTPPTPTRTASAPAPAPRVLTPPAPTRTAAAPAPQVLRPPAGRAPQTVAQIGRVQLPSESVTMQGGYGISVTGGGGTAAGYPAPQVIGAPKAGWGQRIMSRLTPKAAPPPLYAPTVAAPVVHAPVVHAPVVHAPTVHAPVQRAPRGPLIAGACAPGGIGQGTGRFAGRCGPQPTSPWGDVVRGGPATYAAAPVAAPTHPQVHAPAPVPLQGYTAPQRSRVPTLTHAAAPVFIAPGGAPADVVPVPLYDTRSHAPRVAYGGGHHVPAPVPHLKGGYGGGWAPAPAPVAAPRVVEKVPALPYGYRPAWEDGRLNPYRGLPDSGAKKYQRRLEEAQNTGVLSRFRGIGANFGGQRQAAYAPPPAPVAAPVVHTAPAPFYPAFAQQQPPSYAISTQGRTQPTQLRVSTKTAPRAVVQPRATVARQPAPRAVQPRAATQSRTVQVATFANPAQAQRAAQVLANAGMPTRIGNYTKGGQRRQVVILGPFGSQGQVQRAISTAQAYGYSGAFARR
ncbi:MAG: SPOR domain-containing protein [Shimia sp.]